jgi:hypothetical protein
MLYSQEAVRSLSFRIKDAIRSKTQESIFVPYFRRTRNTSMLNIYFQPLYLSRQLGYSTTITLKVVESLLVSATVLKPTLKKINNFTKTNWKNVLWEK